MFFDDVEDVLLIAAKTGAAVFVVPDEVEIKTQKALILKPETKVDITIDQVRQVARHLGAKHSSDLYVMIRPADLMNEEAANALLKNLEEPGQKVHFVLITDRPSRLLPTVLSRAPVYYLRSEVRMDKLKEKDEKVKILAKKLLTARGADLVKLAEEIAKEKVQPRKYALSVLGAAIEMLYKTYFINNQKAFLSKIPKFLAAYDNIAKNGHIKLHLVADLC
jgi:DNA polymerase III delta prime subunit